MPVHSSMLYRSRVLGRILAILVVLALSLESTSSGQNATSQDSAFELKDGDRIVFVGNAFVESAQHHGYIELALTTRWPGRDATFRNIGWAGDTVYGDARRHFTDPPGPYERLIDHVTSINPTVVFVGYGSNVPFDGEDALKRFEDGLNRLLDDLVEATGARIVLLAPPPHEIQMSPVPDDVVRGYNTVLERVARTIGRTARARGHWFVDIFSGLQAVESRLDAPITTDGVNLNEVGYYYVAGMVEDGLGLPPRGWTVAIDTGGQSHSGDGVRISEAKVDRSGGTFTVQIDRLPVTAPSAIPARDIPQSFRRSIAVTGLRSGSYELNASDQSVAVASSNAWADGMPLVGGPDAARAERIRRLITEKNRLYFHQYRPQNETYLVGFRAYEQGQNARELSHFGPLIDEKELEIGQLSMPRPLTFKLVPTAK